ncbi:hypothetical protein Daura_31380 [Dactylosporangium aurantiacum]|uniref:Methylamine utilisation protein MauE domain-containing protein n=1 Tax=Dactylosporangium aurantiacum TaxID=35754 RepID=A0A9Q9MCR8_9ACTN|nr:MauE/DoxX family redox-associated membrane protein [Dactylosporangium aurantiacum]MDG6107217.1 hypothetical protein [Dactylosporangium aurantiacum]UWZ51249.1 hypothetical protein Daura_31380 [Dactylosporangium aurantiacum]
MVLLASSASKLRSGQALRAFAATLAAMRLVPGAAARPVASGVAAAEAVTAVALVAPPSRSAGFALAAVLLAVLTAGVAVVLARGTAVPCRCFGASTAPLSRRHLVRNVVLVAAALAGLLLPAGGLPLAGSVVALLAGAVAGLLVTELDQITALFAPPHHP